MIKDYTLKRLLFVEMDLSSNPNREHPLLPSSPAYSLCRICPLANIELKKKVLGSDYRKTCNTIKKMHTRNCWSIVNWALAKLILEHMPDDVLTYERKGK